MAWSMRSNGHFSAIPTFASVPRSRGWFGVKTQPASFPRMRRRMRLLTVCVVFRVAVTYKKYHIFMSAIAHGAVGPKYRSYFAFAADVRSFGGGTASQSTGGLGFSRYSVKSQSRILTPKIGGLSDVAFRTIHSANCRRTGTHATGRRGCETT